MLESFSEESAPDHRSIINFTAMRISFTSAAGFAAFSLLTGVWGHPNPAQVPMQGLLQSSTEIIADITQTLSLYGLALDLKKLDDLKDVYTQDAVANLGRGPIKGLPALLDYYTKAQGKIPTHHVAGNVYVHEITRTTAKVTSDAIATLFGNGPTYPGTDILVLSHDQIEAFYERFDDEFVKGLDGKWRIKKRDLTLIVWIISQPSVSIGQIRSWMLILTRLGNCRRFSRRRLRRPMSPRWVTELRIMF